MAPCPTAAHCPAQPRAHAWRTHAVGRHSRDCTSACRSAAAAAASFSLLACACQLEPIGTSACHWVVRRAGTVHDCHAWRGQRVAPQTTADNEVARSRRRAAETCGRTDATRQRVDVRVQRKACNRQRATDNAQQSRHAAVSPCSGHHACGGQRIAGHVQPTTRNIPRSADNMQQTPYSGNRAARHRATDNA